VSLTGVQKSSAPAIRKPRWLTLTCEDHLQATTPESANSPAVAVRPGTRLAPSRRKPQKSPASAPPLPPNKKEKKKATPPKPKPPPSPFCLCTYKLIDAHSGSLQNRAKAVSSDDLSNRTMTLHDSWEIGSDYDDYFSYALAQLWDENRYRVLARSRRIAGAFP